MSQTLPPPDGAAGADDSGRHAHPEDATSPFVPAAPPASTAAPLAAQPPSAAPPAAPSPAPPSPAPPPPGAPPGSVARELDTPAESAWSPPGGIVAPPEASALALAAPSGMPAGTGEPVLMPPPASGQGAPLPQPALAGVGAGDGGYGAGDGGYAGDATAQLAPITDATPPPMTAPPVVQQRSTQEVTCPQCGTVVRIDPRARSSLDFCPNPICDYPLFWVRNAIIVTEDYDDGSSHRRMPGTAGRAAAAYLPCPHCSEPNPLSAAFCVRCGGDMHPVAPPPPPPVEPEPAPEPIFTVVEEEEPINWWLIILGGIAITLFVAFLVVIALSYLI